MPVTSAETLSINTIFSTALAKKASDIHLIAGNYPVLRLDTKLFVLADEKVLSVDTIAALVDAWLTPEEKQRLNVDKEVRTIYTWADRARFRASIFYQQGYPVISLRAIPREVPDAKILGIPDLLLERVLGRQGLIIICGPFNAGRTTTMASLLQYVNMHHSKRVVTLERPIEYTIINTKSIVNQREVGKDTPSFIQGMKDLLDEDADIVGISESAEPGIQELALTLAETGKIVIMIMNAASTISAIEHFVDAIPKERRQWAKDSLSSTLLAIAAQRLIPAAGGDRVLATEILTMNAAVTSILQEDKFSALATVLQTSRDEGMISLDYRLLELVRAGKISAEEAKNYALDPTSIRL